MQNIAYMNIPFQIFRNCHTKVFNIIHIFQDCSKDCIDLFHPLPSKLHHVTFHRLKSHTISWPIFPVDQYPFELGCVFNAINLMMADSHQQAEKSQILFQPWCHLYTRKTTGDWEHCPVAHQTKQVPTESLHHWLKPFVAYCKEIN